MSHQTDSICDITSLEDVGYVVVDCKPRLWQSIEHMFAFGDQYFNLPKEKKRLNFSEELFEGYRDIGIEYSETPSRPDLSESFSVRQVNERQMKEFFDDETRLLQACMLEVVRGLDLLLKELLQALHVRFSRDACHGGIPFSCEKGSHLQLNYYQPALADRELLQDRHEDALLVTLTCSTAPGLEIEHGNGKFAPIKVDPGQILVMPGEILALLTGYKIKPLFHRVKRHSEVASRQSMMYFTNPNPGSNLTPWCVNEHNEGVDILLRAITNPQQFGLPPLT